MDKLRAEKEQALLRRLIISEDNLFRAKNYAEYILLEKLYERKDSKGKLILEAFNVALVVCYSIPFSGDEKGAKGIARLPRRFLQIFTPEEKLLHKKVAEDKVGLRNTTYAHADSVAYNLSVNVADVFGMPLILSISRDSFKVLPLTEDDTEALSEMINKLLSRILEERLRIQEILPGGSRF